jgi:hypothetical protein
VYGEPKVLAQILGEALHFLRLPAFGSAHAQGQADYDLADGVVANHLFQSRQIVALVAAL